MSDPEPDTRSFNIGAASLISGTQFILARGDWKDALAFANSAKALDFDRIAFDDARTAVRSIQSDAAEWTSTVYPAVVALANAVYDFGTNKAPTYLPRLAKVLDGLGGEPGNARLLEQAEAIAQLLSRTAMAANAAANAAAAAVTAVASRQAAAERRLASVVSAYATLHRTSSTPDPALPTSLDAPVGVVAEAWRDLAETFDALLQWVHANVKAGRQFRADLSLDAALVEWNTAAAAADDFRVHAYVTTPTIIAV